MREAMAVLTAVAMLIASTWYIWLVAKRRVEPVLASWIILTVTNSLSFITYWCSPSHSVLGNIGNLSGALTILPIMAVIVGYRIRRGQLAFGFNPFQVRCLAGAGGILVAWTTLRFVIGGPTAATVANVLTQVLMVIGYVALAERLWEAMVTTESLAFWGTLFTSALFSLVPALLEHDILGTVYSLRALATSGLTVWLVWRVGVRHRQLGASPA